jgi:CRISPR type III-A-associated RAMP protein Csm4
MNPGLVVKLRPSGPWRIGPDSGARNRVDVIYHSDSLYSAVTAAMSRMGWLEEWLDATARTGTPAVSFSSCFPFLGDVVFVVPPRTVWPPASPSTKAARVRWKSARFVPLTVVQSILAGQRIDENLWSVDGPSDCLVPAGKPGPFRTAVRSNAGVDRLTGSSERHSTACIEFRAGSGLWTVVSFLDESAHEKWSSKVKAAFRLLADTGFGGERSRGWGRSEAPEFTDGMLPDLILPLPPESTAATAEPEIAEAAVMAVSPIAPLVVEPKPELPIAETETPAVAEPVAPLTAAAPETSAVAEPPAEPEAPVTEAASENPAVAELPVEPEVPGAEAAGAPETPAVVEPPVEPEVPKAEAAAAPETRAVAEPPVEPEVPKAEAAAAPETRAVAEPPIEPEVLVTEAAAAPETRAVAEPPVEPEVPVTEVAAAMPANAAVAEAAEPVVEPAQPAPASDAPEPEAPAVETIAAPGPAVEAKPEPEPPVVTGAPTHPHWLLSLFTPAPADSVDWRRGNYTVLPRGGRIDSPAGSGELKKQIQMVAEGSVLYAETAPRGSAADVAPDGFAHPVFRAGFAVAIPLPEVR